MVMAWRVVTCVLASALLSRFVLAGDDASVNDFLDKDSLQEKDVRKLLLEELTAALKPSGKAARQAKRIEQLQTELTPMYEALPKNDEGRLGHSVTRYALHRIMVHHHGWYIKGLEAERYGAARNSSVTPVLMSAQSEESHFQEWVPAFLLWTLERRMGARGISKHELAVMASTIEDLGYREAERLLKSVYDFWKVDTQKPVDKAQARELLVSYMSTYLREVNYTKTTQKDRLEWQAAFRKYYPGSDDLEKWLLGLLESAALSGKKADSFGFNDLTAAVQEVAVRYTVDRNEDECRKLKHFMMGKEEDAGAGRIHLSDFYKQSGGFTADRWVFSEKLDYLRIIGAMDESDAARPKVIIPNYIVSKPQCLEVSSLYGLCCRNECEDLLGHLEEQIGQEAAPPARVLELVEALNSDTIKAPRNLSSALRERLSEVAASNYGRVPLHGRLFAQWMHLAFPRECPFPHEVGVTSPMTPDEWLSEKEGSAYATKEERDCHVTGDCPGGAAALAVSSDGRVTEHDTAKEALPWKDGEELLQELPAALHLASQVAASLKKDKKALATFTKLVDKLVHKGSRGDEQGVLKAKTFAITGRDAHELEV
eukprot:TRINITY_DN101609_c0_g1_i1.p1 TRINITY_DN101609_c0_g1~~TRINITY_DN101609_c0_g1_i1.p1  ORF type:complete len:598 (-),score=174.34 TRINITY_DN101609_c0_g1_i1:77-1870(-)